VHLPCGRQPARISERARNHLMGITAEIAGQSQRARAFHFVAEDRDGREVDAQGELVRGEQRVGGNPSYLLLMKNRMFDLAAFQEGLLEAVKFQGLFITSTKARTSIARFSRESAAKTKRCSCELAAPMLNTAPSAARISARMARRPKAERRAWLAARLRAVANEEERAGLRKLRHEFRARADEISKA
jgi:hypothetical protein